MRKTIIKTMIATTALFLGLAASPANATLIDQESSGTHNAGLFLEDMSGSALGTNAYQVQTFTVGMTGTLDSFDVMLGRIGAATGSVEFQIRNMDGGLVDFSTGPLADVSVNFNLPSGEGYATGDVSGFGINVTAGQMLALVGVTGTVVIPAAAPDDQYINWLASDADPYVGGEYTSYLFSDTGTAMFTGAGYDTLFRTYVTPTTSSSAVPAPSTVLLIAPALFGLLASVRQRRPA